MKQELKLGSDYFFGGGNDATFALIYSLKKTPVISIIVILLDDSDIFFISS